MTCVAAIMRAQFVALAVTQNSQVLLVQRLHLLGFNAVYDGQRLRDAVLALATGYGAEFLVAEPGSWVADELRPISRTLRCVSLKQAKEQLDLAVPATHSELYDHLIERHPKLQRFVTVLPHGEKRVATSNRWRTVPLLAAALGLAAEQLHSSSTSHL